MNERPPSAKARGLAVEAAACEYLRSLGYEIIERNYSSRYGEIDIVAREGGVLVFVEVRYRGGTSLESAAESITWRKLMCVKRAARDYLARRRVGWEVPVRVDACLASSAETSHGKGYVSAQSVTVPGLGSVRFEVIRGAVEFA